MSFGELHQNQIIGQHTMHQIETPLTVALLSIARPTFDVPLAQSVAEAVHAHLQHANYIIVGTGAELLIDANGAEKALTSLADTSYDLLIVLQASFADSSMVVQIVEATRHTGTPTLLWAVPDERDGGRLRLNSLCGINLAGHALARRNITYDYLLCAADDPTALTKIDALARAGCAAHLLRQTRIGLVGEHPAGFDTCSYEPEELQQRFGAVVVPISLASTLQQAAVVPDERRQTFVQWAAQHASNLDTLDADAVAGTAGAYISLREIADREQLQGIAVRCWPEFFTELGCAACGAMSMLNEERCPASCEADVNGTLTSLLLQSLSDSPAFITDLVSIDAESDTGVLWHCGLAPVSMADPEAEIVGTLHSNRKLPLLFEFPLKPGRVTIARLHRTSATKTDAANGDALYQLVIGSGEMIRAPKSYGGTSGVIRFDRPAVEVFDRVMKAGLEHHFCITYGDVRFALRAYAQLSNLSVLEIT